MLGLTRARPERRADYPVRAVFEELAVSRQREGKLVWPAHSDTSRTLQRATTRMATKLCRRPRNVICCHLEPVSSYCSARWPTGEVAVSVMV
jgi:hypothetical protein